MRVIAAALLLILAVIATPVLSVSLSEFDSTVSAFEDFTALLETQSALEAETNEHLNEEDLALLEVQDDDGGANPSYTLPYPAITYAAHAAGGFFHPYSNVNPLGAPWAGFAPVAHPVSVAAAAASPLSAYYAGALQPQVHAALGINTALYPAAFAAAATNAKGGYNVHGLNAGNVYGGYHPGLAADLTSLGGKASEAAGESLIESAAGQYPLASESHDSADIEADADKVAYGLFPAPEAHTTSHFVRSRSYASLGPHKLQFEPVGENEIDDNFSSFVELEAEEAIDADIEAELDDSAEAETEAETETETETEEAAEEPALLEVADDGEEKPENPTYVLPYPPVLPGHFTPLFNPYTNVNPLSTPFANYAAQPGAHPGVAAAAAAQAGTLAAVNGQIAGSAGGYPYYPFAARNPVIAAQLAGNPVPFSGYAGWIHPQNLNSAAVGENEEAASLGQFLEVKTEETEHTACVGCSFD